MRSVRCGCFAIFVVVATLASQSFAQTASAKPAEKPTDKTATAESPLDAQIQKARDRLRKGDLDGAQDAAEAALKLKADSPAANLMMGDVLFSRGEIAQANEYIQKTLKLAPDDAQAWLALSRIANAVSLRKKAAACIEKAHSIAPNDPDVMLAWAGTRSKSTEALAVYEQYLADAKKNSRPEPQWIKQNVEGLKKIGDSETDALVSPVAHYDVPIDYILRDSSHLQGWGVKVAIGNCKPVKLMIDTGSPTILIGGALAEKCGVKKLNDGFVMGYGSKPPLAVYTGLADRMQVGPVEFKNVLVDVEERTPVGDESGLIGTNVLAKFLINLNLNDYKLSLDPLPPIPGDDGKDGPKDRYIAPEMAGYAKVFVIQDHLLIPTKVGADAKAALFMIDTGASFNSIGEDLAARAQKLSKANDVVVKGVQGSVQQVMSADNLTLQFAGFRQMNQRLIAGSQAQMKLEGVQFYGTLGLPILRWFTLHIDYRDGLVGFEYHEPKPLDNSRLR
jgi:tetratricopeptide (TPR) repeat protein